MRIEQGVDLAQHAGIDLAELQEALARRHFVAIQADLERDGIDHCRCFSHRSLFAGMDCNGMRVVSIIMKYVSHPADQLRNSL